MSVRSRQSYIGSSAAPPIVGVPSHGTTAVDVWERIVGLAPEPSESALMRWGKLLEPLILWAYEADTGIRVDRRRRRRYHPDHPFLGATIDGDAGDRIVEAKFSPWADYGEPGDGEDGLTPYVRVQVQHQMMVTGYRRVDVPVLVRGYDLRVFEVEANDEYQRDLRDELVEWWQRHVVERIPPEGQTPEERQAIARAIHRQDSGALLAANEHAVELLRDWQGARLAIKQGERREAEVIASLMEAMGDASTLLAPDGSRVTWKAHERHEVAWREVAASYRRALEARPGAPAAAVRRMTPRRRAEALDAVESLFTKTRVVRPFVPRFAGVPELAGPHEEIA